MTRILLISCALAAAALVGGCSSSDGEDEPFFSDTPNNLTSFVRNNCNNISETAAPVRIGDVGFGSDALSQTAEPDDSGFTRDCVETANASGS